MHVPHRYSKRCIIGAPREQPVHTPEIDFLFDVLRRVSWPDFRSVTSVRLSLGRFIVDTHVHAQRFAAGPEFAKMNRDADGSLRDSPPA